MKAKTRFMKMFNKLPEKARTELVYRYWEKHEGRPYSLNIVALEVRNNTELGKKIIQELGFEDD